MDSKKAYELAELESSKYVHCMVTGYSGHMVCADDQVAIVDEEGDITELPSFITNKLAAEVYLKQLDAAFRQGERDGSESLANELRKLLGCAPRGQALRYVTEHEERHHKDA